MPDITIAEDGRHEVPYDQLTEREQRIKDLGKMVSKKQSNYISVCKNVIASNNKRGWVDPDPSIRVSNTPSGKVQKRAHTLAIKDAQGNTVARIVSTQDGEPVIKCGAKVAIITEYETEIEE